MQHPELIHSAARSHRASTVVLLAALVALAVLGYAMWDGRRVRDLYPDEAAAIARSKAAKPSRRKAATIFLGDSAVASVETLLYLESIGDEVGTEAAHQLESLRKLLR